jgi:hypothetical protein
VRLKIFTNVQFLSKKKESLGHLFLFLEYVTH